MEYPIRFLSNLCRMNLYKQWLLMARLGCDVARKIVLILWHHGQRCNETILAMRDTFPCLPLQESAWIHRTRSRWVCAVSCVSIKYPMHVNSISDTKSWICWKTSKCTRIPVRFVLIKGPHMFSCLVTIGNSSFLYYFFLSLKLIVK